MNQKATFPELMRLDQVAEVLNRTLLDVRTLIEGKVLVSGSMESIPTASVGIYLVDVLGMETDEAEALMASIVCRTQYLYDKL